MPPITEDQRAYCRLAQFSQVLDDKATNNDEWLEMDHIQLKIDKELSRGVLDGSSPPRNRTTFDDLLQVDDINLKILSNKSSGGALEGSTPLHIAGFYKHIDTFDSLLKRGANFTAKNNNGDTALHQAFSDMSFRRDIRGRKCEFLENKFLQSVLNAHVESGNFENPRSAHGLSHFHVACAVNHLKAVTLFLNNGVSVDESVNDKSPIFPGYSPLHFAASCGGYATAKLLLEHGADIRIKDIKRLTPLHIVVERTMELKRFPCLMPIKDLNVRMKENQKMTKMFLEDFRSLDADSMGFRKIHAACTLSDSSLAKRFLRDIEDIDCAVSLDSPTWPGFTALHFAVQFNVDTAKLLLDKGADIGAEDAEGKTPLDFCIRKDRIKNLHGILSEVPAFKGVLFSDNTTRLSDFINATQSVSTLNTFFHTTPSDLFLPKDCPLWSGYCLSHLFVHFSELFCSSTIQKYLSSDRMTMIPDAHGRTLLHLSCYRQASHIVDNLIRHQIVKADVIDENGLSLLHIACDRKNHGVVRRLLSQGANVNVIYRGKKINSTMNAGSTPLHTAVLRGYFENIRMLLKYGADVNTVDADGMTPIHCILALYAQRKSISLIADLLFSSPNIENVVSSKTGLSHLHIASCAGNKNAVTELLKLGADVNAVLSYNNTTDLSFIHIGFQYSGYTPLHFAMENQDTQLVSLLLQSGADVHLKKPNSMTRIYDKLIHNNIRIESTDFNMKITKTFASILANNAALQKQVEDDCGLTLLHIATFLHDFNHIETLLSDSGAQVNAQIHADSPIWPKATSLHILTECAHHIEDFERKVKLLLDYGADVTLMNNEGDSPVHKVWSAWSNRKYFSEMKIDCIQFLTPLLFRFDYDILCSLLRYHKEFTINPVNEEGISHFHLACLVSEFTIVEKFLKNGIDVNLPIDYRNKTMTFQTPLRFLLESLSNRESRLRTVDVLLKYGADVNVSDEQGFTPLLQVAWASTSRIFHLQKPHEVNSTTREFFLRKLHKAGASFHSTNMKGESVLEILFHSEHQVTDEELQFFIDCCYSFNTFNSLSGKGIISIMLQEQTYPDEEMYNPKQKLTLNRIIEIPSLFTNDRMGRTPIHNLVASHKTTIPSEMYAYYIEKFIKMGYEIDAQDSEGKTALHTAAYFGNAKAFSGLLIAGADANIVDNGNLTPHGVALLEIRSQRREDKLHVPLGDVHSCIISKIKTHTSVRVACGLEVDSRDLQFFLKTKSIFGERVNSYREEVWKELEGTQLIKIGTGSLTLRDFLSETGAVASRPSMTCEADRCAVDNYFESIDVQRFPHLKTVLKVQYRKALKRLALMGDATNSVRILVGNVNELLMPEICCRMILRFLSNTEIKHLIKSVSSVTTT